MTDPNLELCGTSTPGEGCGGMFRRKTSPGLCAKCQHLTTLVQDQMEQERFSNIPQCNDCGLAFRNITGMRCGTCKHLDNSEQGRVDQTLVDKQQERSNAFAMRLTRGGTQPRQPASNSLSQINNQPSIALNSDSISAAKQATGPSREPYITVCIDVRIKGKISSLFGSSTRAHPESVTMTELHADAVAAANKVWLKTHDQSLNREDTELRWHGNKPPEEGTELMSLGEFYQAHQAVPHSGAYFDNVPKQHAKLKGKRICMELWVNEESFDARVDPDFIFKNGKGKKRAMAPLGESDFPKRPRVSGPMESSFVFSKRPSLAPSEPKDSVTLQIAKCLLVDQTGEVEIEWKGPDAHVVGELSKKPLAQGKSKRVYSLTLKDKAYVAKRFFDIGKGEEEISVDDNASHLEAELLRAKRGHWFWQRFKECAAQHHREIATDVQFVQPLLAKEIVDFTSTPSAASNASQSDVADSECQAVYWLLEERRTPVVNNYSYTLSHPDQHGIKGKTIVAFTHFTWLHSQQTLVFADMQGSPARGSNGQPIEMLFDPMTHSPTADTGLGDYGQQGIDAFLSQHRCNKICVDIGLEALRVGPDPDGVEDMDEESDEDA